MNLTHRKQSEREKDIGRGKLPKREKRDMNLA